MRSVIFYKTASGKCPVRDFLDSLNVQQARKVTWVLKLVEDLSIVPDKYLKKLTNTDEIWEVRAAAGNDIFRLFGFFDGGDFIVLVHGFQKKTQKTPGQDIATAERRRREYFLRRNGDV